MYINIIILIYGEKSMKYKQQVQTRAEAITNLLETFERGILANAISKQEAANILKKLKSLISEIDNFADLED